MSQAYDTQDRKLVARARMAGPVRVHPLDYGPGQNPPAGAGHVMSLAISA